MRPAASAQQYGDLIMRRNAYHAEAVALEAKGAHESPVLGMLPGFDVQEIALFHACGYRRHPLSRSAGKFYLHDSPATSTTSYFRFSPEKSLSSRRSSSHEWASC